MTNAEVARVFNQVADLMEIKGEDSFRVSSYRRVARSIDDLPGELSDIAARGELAELPGVGKASAAKIQELLATGKLRLREELAAEVPESLLGLLSIQGMGPKKAAMLWRERGITDVQQLSDAIAEGKLAGLRGLGDKSIEHIRQGIEFLQRSAGRTRIGVAWPIADLIARSIAGIDGVRRVEHAGSLRRGCETVGDLDILCVADNGPAVIGKFTSTSIVAKVLVSGDTKGSVLVNVGDNRQIQIDLRVVPEQSFGAAWQYFTGSKEHNVRLREMAVKRGWSLNEYALTEGERIIASRGEEDIYAALGLPWIPPELREDRGEFELKQTPADLIALDDIRGDLHMHTVASDGHHSIEEMAAAAQKRGYKFICITDHSQSSVIANGLKPDRLRQHVAAIRRVAKSLKGFTLWAGAEVDVLSDGRLDYPDELLAELDWVVASVHIASHDSESNTRRTLAAIENPYVNVIAHPTGRMIGKRDAMPIDIDAIARKAAATGTALEINASAYRLDLKDQHARLARSLGVTICIDTDAHAIEQLDQMQFGVVTARRAGLRRDDVLNTRSAKEIEKFVKAKPKRAK
ncbi:MAG: DNA polymerase/3'-5' exonuclease PolX [Phycisphaerae bacterium]